MHGAEARCYGFFYAGRFRSVPVCRVEIEMSKSDGARASSDKSAGRVQPRMDNTRHECGTIVNGTWNIGTGERAVVGGGLRNRDGFKFHFFKRHLPTSTDIWRHLATRREVTSDE